MQQVHQCIERCHAPLAQAQALVTRELEKFQVRNIPDRALWSLLDVALLYVTNICYKTQGFSVLILLTSVLWQCYGQPVFRI